MYVVMLRCWLTVKRWITNIQSVWFQLRKKSKGTTNILSRLQPKLLGYYSLRNSEYNQEKKIGCSNWFLSQLKSSGLDFSNLAKECLWFCILKLETPQVMASVHCTACLLLWVSRSHWPELSAYSTLVGMYAKLQDCQLRFNIMLSSHIKI